MEGNTLINANLPEFQQRSIQNIRDRITSLLADKTKNDGWLIKRASEIVYFAHTSQNTVARSFIIEQVDMLQPHLWQLIIDESFRAQLATNAQIIYLPAAQQAVIVGMAVLFPNNKDVKNYVSASNLEFVRQVADQVVNP